MATARTHESRFSAQIEGTRARLVSLEFEMEDLQVLMLEARLAARELAAIVSALAPHSSVINPMLSLAHSL